ncbi:response regulator transcription factor [Turneriella parva]|uniref:Response regulator receiver protein n=1 Tax=Turneriella parva (strain ATCC BAA-1111 / DSM 21527 / NCTC 11395 / H) TaxID=869212 RepID=I4B5G3_TURPD|nr:response regulator [Turneriella parva]AFM12520.1 response regulator receiver protein [Turneriella parva DSM 21527]
MASSHKQILIIEDSAPIAMLQKALLEKAGYTVEHAETGLGGLESATLIKPAAVVLDLTLPDTDGITVLKALRGMPAEIRPEVIVLSADDGSAMKAGAIDAGAFGFMLKPFRHEEYLRMVAASCTVEG